MSPATNVPATITVVVVDVARARLAVVSLVTLHDGALVQATLNVTVHDVPPTVPVVILPATSVPTNVAAVVPHEAAEVLETTGAVPLPKNFGAIGAPPNVILPEVIGTDIADVVVPP